MEADICKKTAMLHIRLILISVRLSHGLNSASVVNQSFFNPLLDDIWFMRMRCEDEAKTNSARQIRSGSG